MKCFKFLVPILLVKAVQAHTFRRTKGSKGTKGKRTRNDNVLYACMDTYPGYPGDLEVGGSQVAVKFDGLEIDFHFDLNGVEQNCSNCGIHIHQGITCDSADKVGGHYWYAGADPWTSPGAVYKSDHNGRAKSKFDINSGYNIDQNDGHAVVIHAQNGSIRIGCGVLSRDFKCPSSRKRSKGTKGQRALRRMGIY